MDPRTYQQNRAALFAQIAELVKDTDGIVLFRQVGASWTPDTLTATMPVPDEPGVFFVLGSYFKLPGWDESVIDVENWQALFELVAKWVQEMKDLAKTTKAKKRADADKKHGFVEEEDMVDKTPTHVWWIPEKDSFSNACGNFLARDPSVIAPPSAVTWADRIQKVKKRR